MDPKPNGISDPGFYKVIDKMCKIYRENVISRFRETVPGETPSRSPETLGLNALIAEHLHNQGYVLTESVFSAEIELPKLGETGSLFRLKHPDIKEILGAALNQAGKDRDIEGIVECYERNKTKSLLSVLLSASNPKLLDTTTHDLLAFNKYLKILVSRIAKVSLVLSELKRRRKELNHGKLSTPTKKRRRSSGNNQIRELVRRIERLTNRLSTLHPNNANNATTDLHRMTYQDWIRELKSSKNGKKMIRKIERIIVNSLKREQMVMERKLDSQKMFWRLHYKRKFLEQFHALNLPMDVKLNEKDKPEKKRPMESISEDEDEPAQKATGRRKKASAAAGNRNAARPESTNRQIRLRKVEQLVNVAKDRIQFLQAENERLDRSFNSYLERQTTQTATYQKDVSAIWDSYNVDRLLLQEGRPQRPEKVIQSGNKRVTLEECREFEVGLPIGRVTAENSSNDEFSNPFIKFDIKRFLESTRTTTKQTAKDEEAVIKSSQTSC